MSAHFSAGFSALNPCLSQRGFSEIFVEWMCDSLLLSTELEKKKVDNDVGRVSEYFQELLNCLEREKNWAYDCWGNGFYTHRVKLSLCLESWECEEKYDVQAVEVDWCFTWKVSLILNYIFFLYIFKMLEYMNYFFIQETSFLGLILYYQKSNIEQKMRPSCYSFS